MATEVDGPSLEQKFSRILCGHFKNCFCATPGAVGQICTVDLRLTMALLYCLSYNGKLALLGSRYSSLFSFFLQKISPRLSNGVRTTTYCVSARIVAPVLSVR